MIKPRDRIIYIPNHVISLVEALRQPIERDEDGSMISIPNTFLSHPNCEPGFVTSVTADRCAFCRFWYKVEPFTTLSLRTKSCSEKVSLENLLLVTYQQGITQEDIDRVCEEYSICLERT